MNAFALFQAAAVEGVNPLAPESGFFNFSSTEGKVILGVIILVLLVFGSWIVYALAVPKKRRHHHEHHHHRPHRHHHHHHDEYGDDDERKDAEGQTPTESAEDSGNTVSSEDVDAESQHERRYRKRRHRRREHRPRNPTLAETGGLPPIRTEAPPGP